MKPSSFAFILMASLSLSGCGAVRNLMSTLPPAPSIPFRTLSPSREFPNTSPGGQVFKSKAEVDEFLSKHPQGMFALDGSPVPETFPQIDFAKEEGVLVLFGVMPSTGYRGEVGAVEDKGDRLIVHAILRGGGGGDMASFPWSYVAIARTDKPIEFAPTGYRTKIYPFF